MGCLLRGHRHQANVVASYINMRILSTRSINRVRWRQVNNSLVQVSLTHDTGMDVQHSNQWNKTDFSSGVQGGLCRCHRQYHLLLMFVHILCCCYLDQCGMIKELVHCRHCCSCVIFNKTRWLTPSWVAYDWACVRFLPIIFTITSDSKNS